MKNLKTNLKTITVKKIYFNEWLEQIEALGEILESLTIPYSKNEYDYLIQYVDMIKGVFINKVYLLNNETVYDITSLAIFTDICSKADTETIDVHQSIVDEVICNYIYGVNKPIKIATNVA